MADGLVSAYAPNTSGTVGNTAYTQVSPLADPAYADLFQQTLGAIPQNLAGITSLISQGINSPLLQAILGPALQRLQVPQAQQRQQFTESARAAGGLRGSQYGKGMNQLVQGQGLQQNDLISQVIQQVLGSLVQGQLQSQQQQFLPAQTMGNLLGRIQPQTIQGNIPSVGGGGGYGGGSYGGGGGSSFLGTAAGDIAAMNARTASNPNFTGYGGGGGDLSSMFRQLSSPVGAPAEYMDPFQGGGSVGSYDIGGGTQYLAAPQDQYGYTQQDWAADPFYSNPSGGYDWGQYNAAEFDPFYGMGDIGQDISFS